jgi:hypothetical protein
LEDPESSFLDLGPSLRFFEFEFLEFLFSGRPAWPRFLFFICAEANTAD